MRKRKGEMVQSDITISRNYAAWGYPRLVCIQRFKLFSSELANNYVQIIAEEGERDLNNISRPDTETTDFSLSIH